MHDDILQNYANYMLYLLLASFLIIALWESIWPRRMAVVSTPRRWLVNFGLFAVNFAGHHWLMPLGYFGASILAQQFQWGLFQRLSLDPVSNVVLTVVLFDLIRYVVHRAFHSLPLLWRFHAAHHSDPDYDLTIGFRFHPVESLVTWYLNLAFIFLLAPSPFAVFVLEALFMVNGLFAHGNVRLPERVDRVLRLLLVTPDMHRVHHSDYRPETDSNYGTIFSVWDRWFGSYTERARTSLEQLRIGLVSVPAQDALNIGNLLIRPFRRNAGETETAR